MNIYDFDKTIFKGDCSLGFYFFCMRKKPLLVLRYLLLTIIWGIKYLLKIISFQELKEKMFSFVTKIDKLENLVNIYWDKNIKRINEWYYEKQKANDCVITASFDFIVNPICKRLNIKNVIATKYDLKTGKIIGKNNHDFEKVERFNNEFPKTIVNEAYSDSLSDIPMLELAKNPYLVCKKDIKAFVKTEKIKKKS